MAWKVECTVCGKKESFGDAKDVSYAKWRVLAWIVPSGEPRVLCPECEYPPKPKEKKNAVVHNSNLQPKDDGEPTGEVT